MGADEPHLFDTIPWVPSRDGKVPTQFVNRHRMEAELDFGMEGRVREAEHVIPCISYICGNPHRPHGIPDADTLDLDLRYQGIRGQWRRKQALNDPEDMVGQRGQRA